MNYSQPYLLNSGFISLPSLIIFLLERSMHLEILRSFTQPQYAEAASAKRMAKINSIPNTLMLS